MSNNLIGMSYRDRPEDMADISQEEFKRRRRAQNLAADYVKKYQTGEAAAEAMDKEIYSVDNLDDFDLRSGGSGSALAKPGADGKGYEPGDGTQTIGTRQYGAGEARYSIDDARSLWKEGKFTLGELQAYGEGLEEGAIYGAGTQRYIDNQIAKYGADAYYGDTLPGETETEVIIDDDRPLETVEVVDENLDTAPISDTTPVNSSVITDSGSSGSGSGIDNKITQVNQQVANAYNKFGNISNVGNNNVISGNGYMYIDNSQVGGNNTATNTSTQNASINNLVSFGQPTVYNPVTGQNELDLSRTQGTGLQFNPVLGKFMSQPFMRV